MSKHPELQQVATDVTTLIDLLLGRCSGCGWRGTAITVSAAREGWDGKRHEPYASLRCTNCLRENPLYDQFHERAVETLGDIEPPTV